MFRFIGLIWDSSNPAQSSCAASLSKQLRASQFGWQRIVDRPGVQLVCSGSREGGSEPYLLSADCGAVVGTIFHRPTDEDRLAPRPRFGEGETLDIVRSRGEALVRRFWGRYVAFVINGLDGGRIQVLRSPVEALPCYYTRTRGVYVFFSDIAGCESLELGPYSVNWHYLRAHVFAGHLPPSEATALSEVWSVRPGECVQLDRGEITKKTFYWRPFRVATEDIIEDATEAAAALRRTIVQCTHAWVRDRPRILHRLSGGLDSNIVLAALRSGRVNAEVMCLNYHSEGSDSDERVLARVGARQARCKLVELRRNSNLKLEPILAIAKSPVPTFYVGFLEISQREAELAAEAGATAISDGGGGDPLFYQARASFAAGDYVFAHGLRPALIKIAYSAARLDHLSIGEVLGRAVREGIFKRMWSPKLELGGRRQFQRLELFEDADHYLDFPCTDGIGHVPSGKRWHVLGLAYPFNFYDPFGRESDPEQIHPLMSQPVVELALRIPSYILTHGGVYDRALTRRAFANDVPQEIVWRRTKGGMEEHARALMLGNLEFIRECILDGELVRRGLLDKRRIEEFLALHPMSFDGRGGGMHEIFEYLNVEAWLHRMSGDAGAALPRFPSAAYSAGG